jgi:hypothetical protein
VYHDCDAASHVDEPGQRCRLIQRLREDTHIATSPKLTTVAAAHNSMVIATKR